MGWCNNLSEAVLCNTFCCGNPCIFCCKVCKVCKVFQNKDGAGWQKVILIASKSNLIARKSNLIAPKLTTSARLKKSFTQSEKIFEHTIFLVVPFGIFWYLLSEFLQQSGTKRYQKIPHDTQPVLLSIGNSGTKRYQKVPLDTTTFFLTGNFSASEIVMLLIDRGLTLLQIIYYIFNIIYNSIR